MQRKEELISNLRKGKTYKFVLFCQHRKSTRHIDKNCMSQWYQAGFTEDGYWFPTAEHYMMAGKAKLFGTEKTLKNVLACKTPKEAKRVGREISGFDSDIWDKNKFEVVVNGNLLKFSQNAELKAYLLSTKDKVLVEASPTDKIWGIGLPESSPDAFHPEKWRGDNLLGFALMKVREILTSDNTR